MSKFFNKIIVSEDTKRFVSKSLEIGDEILRLLEEKGMSQKDLAEKLNKKESQVSKWLTGTHNFTLKTITTIEAAIGEDLILTSTKAKESTNKKVELKQYVPNLPPSSKNNEFDLTAAPQKESQISEVLCFA